VDMRPSEIELHIDELILEGFDPADQKGIGEAVRLELTRLMGERGLPPALRGPAARDVLAPASLAPAPDASPEAVGAGIAEALHGRLTG
jgi:hypothetical protein